MRRSPQLRGPCPSHHPFVFWCRPPICPGPLSYSCSCFSAYVASRPGPCHGDGVNAEQISLLQVTQSATCEFPTANLYYLPNFLTFSNQPPLPSPPFVVFLRADLGVDIGLSILYHSVVI
ncbi:hypothetical protein ASPBRDRAFT_558537 [Aspergillus brasiliensis CBS 101740]|uniref:Uncharacterized protein n=1 Tax=Aspergillus brasiliensis (strain CBS 101740 / IMI 381727 / IBT 21946) TaxID=767769 RepID=A0A1L9UMN9_ASPBC|nr:hypothetical protein ASPBRDRAFT_558537 [Aspergillus brasiliensis CBS 101740]